MSEKVYLGRVTAYLYPRNKNEKGRSKQTGYAYKDPENGDISFVIDTLPIPGTGWRGWCNIRVDKENGKGDFPKPEIVDFNAEEIPF